MKIKNTLLCLGMAIATLSSASGRTDMSKQNLSGYLGKTYVRGGQFKDLILPMPIIDGLESEGIWGGANVIPRDVDNGMEDQNWYFWGGNPIKEKDGKYHVAICRWPAEKGFNGWHHSETAHYVSDHPMGPYQFTSTIVEMMHNPETIRLKDGTYALHGMRNRVYAADTMAGPWEQVGTMALDTRGLREDKNMGNNITTTLRPDGSILAMTKIGDITVSNTGMLGPFKMVSTQTYDSGTGRAEDPVVWRSRHQYHAIYNRNQNHRAGYMRSLDGIHWKNAFGRPYIDGTDYNYYYTDGTANSWFTLERPKVIQDELGRATHLTFGVTDVDRAKAKMPEHGAKNLIMPLVTERMINIVENQPVNEETRKIQVAIDSEKGLDDLREIDIQSLRFGSDSVVNYGGGGRATASEIAGEQLIIRFVGDFGITHHDYDLKLLGETKTGSLVIGYALLPGKSPDAPSLIALPHTLETVDGDQTLTCMIENAGLSPSAPQSVKLYRYTTSGRTLIREIPIPAIEPYKSHEINHVMPPSDRVEKGGVEYAVVIPGTPGEYWQLVDIENPAVTFEGHWTPTPQPNVKCFLGTQRESSTAGDSVTFKFKGTRAMVYGRVGSGLGAVRAYINGEYIETYTCHYRDRYHEKIFQTPLLPDGEHTITLIKDEHWGDKLIAIDSFAFESEKNTN